MAVGWQFEERGTGGSYEVWWQRRPRGQGKVPLFFGRGVFERGVFVYFGSLILSFEARMF